MKRTRASILLACALTGGVITYLLELLAQSLGGNVVVPPLSLSLTVLALAIAVVLLAVPVRRWVTGKRKAPIDPFYALRVAVFAKASSLAGSLLLGATGGILIFLLGRPIPLPAPTGVLVGSEIVASALLVAAGLIAEYLCTLPPQNPEDPRGKSVSEPAA
jgi:MFS family permease